MSVRFLSGVNVDQNTLFVDDVNNRVGIGTASPSEKFSVYGGDAIFTQFTGAGNGSFLKILNSTTTTNGTTLQASYFGSGGFGDLKFEVGGSERLRITSAGNVGIGTTSPAHRLTINAPNNTIAVGIDFPSAHFDFSANSTSGYNSRFHMDNVGMDIGHDSTARSLNLITADVDRVTILGNGNVGIGTTSPSAKLEVVGATGVITIRTTYPTDLSQRGALLWKDATNITGAIDTRYDGTTVDMYFGSLYSSGYNSTTRMVIKGNGNVGIGTTAPGYKLEVEDTIGIKRAGVAATSTIQQTGAGLTVNAPSGYHPLIVQYAGTEFARINNSGNVGIGTTAPSSLLHVSGTNTSILSSIVENTSSASGAYAGYLIKSDYAHSYLPGLLLNSSTNTAYAGADQLMLYQFHSKPISLVTNNIVRLMVSGAGNVGIGATDPLRKLHVVGNFAVNAGTGQYYGVNITGGEGTNPNILIGDWHNASANLTWDSTNRLLRIDAQYSTSGAPIVFSGNDAALEYARFTATGNFGIGTTGPANKLVAVADATFNGENTYAIAAASSTDVAYKTIVGYDYANDIGVISAVRTGIGWKNLSILPVGNTNLGVGTLVPSQRLHVSGNVRVTGAYYDSSNSAGSSGQVLSSTGSGTAWVNQGEATATSLFDLLPAARVSYNWVGQVVNDTWTTVFSKSSNLLTTGTWMVKMYVSDFATGGGHYTYTYSGMFTWYQDTTNQGGEQAASEIYLHRMGHAANASVLYLRTTETTAASSGDGFFQIKGNYSNTANQTIQFQFVKIF
jgi:hypothetical protein